MTKKTRMSRRASSDQQYPEQPEYQTDQGATTDRWAARNVPKTQNGAKLPGSDEWVGGSQVAGNVQSE